MLSHWMQSATRFWKAQRTAKRETSAPVDVKAELQEQEELIRLAKEDLKELQPKLDQATKEAEQSASTLVQVPTTDVDAILTSDIPPAQVAQWRKVKPNGSVVLPENVTQKLQKALTTQPAPRRASGSTSSVLKSLPPSSEMELLRRGTSGLQGGVKARTRRTRCTRYLPTE
ncbi:hypothetical protein ADEAN_000132400 [Angomonas deanei]|uniref:Uncharacterized protein n=1 Tax=Angomonas deanei TaxID=59799 RepID=A0A7G2C3Z1_9TRYP|nr:hypothetical protein ADEAN_000132400 [Angomonas deanei]